MMHTIRASHLPEGISAPEEAFIERDGVRVVAASLDPAAIDAVCAALLEARGRLQRVPVARIIAAIDRAAERLLDDSEPERHDVLRSLEMISGFSSPMARHLLDRAAGDWRAAPLHDLVNDELGGVDAIESFRRDASGRGVRAVAPPLGLHIFSGNVPGVGVTSVVRALLVRSAVLGKSASGEPALAPAFARLLSRVDPDVGAAVAITWWRGGDRAIENAAMARAGLVVHYGAKESVEDLRTRAPAHVRVIEHGPRISFAVVKADGLGSAGSSAAARLARAVALFDQQGCVSPQVAWVIGTREQARDFAAATAAALDGIQRDLPRGRLEPAEAAAIHAMRTRAEFGDIAGRGGALWTGEGLAWTVILSDDPTFEGTCLNRTLMVKHVPGFANVIERVAPFRDVLQTVGLEGFREDRQDAAVALGEAGATRITTLDGMPWPPAGWHHDGRGPLRELVRWVDLEG